MMQFNRVLEGDEQILWTGSPKFGLWLADRLVGVAIIGLFGWLMVALPFVTPVINPEYVGTTEGFFILVGVGLACQLPAVFVFFQSVYVHSKFAYAVTSKRILMQKPGRWGSLDMVSIRLNEVKDMQLNQDAMDLLFGGKTKSVLFSTADSYQHHFKSGLQYTPKRLEHVENADEVFRINQAHTAQSDSALQEPVAFTPPPASPFLPTYESDLPIANLPPAITSVLRPNEKILWQGKPQRWPFILHYLPLNLGLALSAGMTAWSYFTDHADFIRQMNRDTEPFIVASLCLLIGPLIYRSLAYARVNYVVTDHRVLVVGGAIGTDIESFEREQITKVFIRSGFLDSVLGRGSASVVLDTFNRQQAALASIWWKGNELQHIAQASTVMELLKPQSIVADRNSASFVPLPGTK